MAGLGPAIHVLLFLTKKDVDARHKAGHDEQETGTTKMSSSSQLQPVLDRIDADFDNSLERLFTLLRIKSISADPAFAGDCKAAAEHLARDIVTLGFAAEVRPTAGHPAIVATSNGNDGARPHVLFYGHYDVQPVDPLNLWHRPPFEPAVTDHADGRKIIVARGAEDDKGQLMTFVEACRAWKSVTGSLPLDVTIVIEGEEEIGSKNFVPFLEANKKDLHADFALVCDTGMWDRNTPAITTSLRGLVYDEVRIKAANRDLHSGIFGGGAQNPIRVLTRILGSLHDDNGHITLPGFYDGVKDLPPDILAQWKNLNLTPVSFLKPIGLSIPAGETDRLLIEQVSSRPTCDINGIIGGYTGEGSKTVIPAEASAKVSFRLVEGQEPAKIRKAFRDYVTARLPADCRAEFTDHSNAPAIALDWNMKPLAAARRALTDEWGKEAVLMGSGASIPIVADFKKTLGLDTVLVGFGLDDDNIHSPNEKYDLRSFHKGIRSWARILSAFADAPKK
jgi:acetylornithine deacetylase/succinyl-diaminopimelate desuccinylase-like protein